MNRLQSSTRHKTGVKSVERRFAAESGSNVHADLHLVADFGEHGFAVAATEQLSRSQDLADRLDSDRDNVR